jgi:hypothetical protein
MFITVTVQSVIVNFVIFFVTIIIGILTNIIRFSSSLPCLQGTFGLHAIFPGVSLLF